MVRNDVRRAITEWFVGARVACVAVGKDIPRPGFPTGEDVLVR